MVFANNLMFEEARWAVRIDIDMHIQYVTGDEIIVRFFLIACNGLSRANKLTSAKQKRVYYFRCESWKEIANGWHL